MVGEAFNFSSASAGVSGIGMTRWSELWIFSERE